MAGHEQHAAETSERRQLGERTGSMVFLSLVVGVIGLVVALVVGFIARDGFRGFLFSYLTSFAFFLSIALGALFFVLMQHMTRAGWSVGVRRVAEGMSSTLPVMAALSLPILISVLIVQNGGLYRWAQHAPEHGAEHGAEHGKEAASMSTHNAVSPGHQGAAEEGASQTHATSGPAPHTSSHANITAANPGQTVGASDPIIGGRADNQALYKDHHPSENGVQPPDELMLKKRVYLNPAFFTARMVGYFLILSVMALWYAGHSKRQDVDHDPDHTVRMESWAARCVLIFALTITFLGFDLLMSLDPHWYSTMFGVYYFSGGMLGFFATFILLLRFLQGRGYLTLSVNTEHYHDLGKWLFAFVFFWGYIAFSQYMLIWYASLPEEVFWFARRGATTAVNDMNPWGLIICIVVVCQLLLPFPGLLSRHVKRNPFGLLFWSAWVLPFHYLDLMWIIVPELDGKFHPLVMVGCVASFVGVGGIFFAATFRALGSASLIPAADPRIENSLAFHNM